MMCSGETILASELRDLLQNPLLRPLLLSLVLTGPATGYLEADGATLRHYKGTHRSLMGDESLRIAHPVDLQATGVWLEWQRECVSSQRSQPFKQVFRELYRLTDAERHDADRSRRFDRQRFRPAPGFAALASRGWFYDHEAGLRRVDHATGITADVTFDEPLEQPSATQIATVRYVLFSPKGTWQPMPLEAVPPRVFSEVMRDVDLMISAGFAGEGVPPCDSASLEMRASLVQTACAQEGLANVAVDGRRALIHGKLSDYTVHLGTGMIHCQPGGQLCVIPTESQRPQDVVMPFPCDDDLKTVEIMSNILALARDDGISDASVLKQIRGD
jgi:hypothetical protein